MIEKETLQSLKIVHAKHKRALHSFPNVVGTMISTKRVNGEDTGVPCITVLVRKKVAKEDLRIGWILPQAVDNVPTDVVESGEIRKVGTGKQGRLRPAPRGASIGQYQITAGTFGAIVYKSGIPYILSNNHVLANENRAKIGDPILQPGAFDGGQVSTDTIAHLSNFVPVTFPGSTPSGCPYARNYVGFGNWVGRVFGKKTRIPPPVSITATYNTVDCAIASPIDPHDLSNEVFEGGHIPTGTIDAFDGQNVFKSGRTTCFTTGKVTGLDATVNVGYDQGPATFDQQIVLGPGMSKGGDSGSIVQEVGSDKVVGLLFAGSDTTTIVNPISLVLSALKITLT